jgi:hypothetical protein
MFFFGAAVRVGKCSGVVNISYELRAVADSSLIVVLDVTLFL